MIGRPQLDREARGPSRRNLRMFAIPELPLSSLGWTALENQNLKASGQQGVREGSLSRKKKACAGKHQQGKARSSTRQQQGKAAQKAQPNSASAAQRPSGTPGRNSCGFFGGRRPFESPPQDRAETLVGGSENAATQSGAETRRSRDGDS